MKRSNLFKIIVWAVLVLAFVLWPIAVFCQTNGAAADGVAAPPAPQALSPWVAMIPLMVPMVLMGVKTALPKLPSWMVPILAPLLGAGADIAMYYMGMNTLGPVGGALMGSAGTGLREIGDQLKKRLTNPAEPPTP